MGASAYVDGPRPALTATTYAALLAVLAARGVEVSARSIVPQVDTHECFGFTLWCVDVSGAHPVYLGRVLGPHDGFFNTMEELRAALWVSTSPC